MATVGRSAHTKGFAGSTHENECFIIQDCKIEAKPIREIEEHFGYIYITKDILHNKYYLGLRYKKYRTLSYLGSGKYLKAAIKKYGKENFYKIIIDFADSKEDLENLEAFYIQEYFGYDIAKSSLWYNIYDGKQRGGNSWAGYSKEDRERRIKLTLMPYNQHREFSPSWRKQHSIDQKKYMSNANNRMLVAERTQQGMNNKAVADKINSYIKYPIIIDGVPYYSASSIARRYDIPQGTIYSRLRRGQYGEELIKPFNTFKDTKYWSYLHNRVNKIRTYESYCKKYYVKTNDTYTYVFLSSSYVKLSHLLKTHTDYKVGKNTISNLIKGYRHRNNGIISISVQSNNQLKDSEKLLFSCAMLNHENKNKCWGFYLGRFK